MVEAAGLTPTNTSPNAGGSYAYAYELGRLTSQVAAIKLYLVSFFYSTFFAVFRALL